MRISDWSSDVCSSDLPRSFAPIASDSPLQSATNTEGQLVSGDRLARLPVMARPREGLSAPSAATAMRADRFSLSRSEERRVGKECVSTGRSRCGRVHQKKKETTSGAAKCNYKT